MPEFIHRSRIAASAREVFEWHSRPGAFERLKPPWEKVSVIERSGTIKNGDRITIVMQLGPLRQKWIAEHRDYIPGRQFRDVQIKGPFARWEHTHSMRPDGANACVLEDRIRYELPFGKVGHLLGARFTHAKLEKMFDYRHRITSDDLQTHKSGKGGKTMRILVSGSTGLIGSELVPFLTTGGHEVKGLTRSASANKKEQVHWDIHSGTLDKNDLIGIDAVVHLAGENIAGRWNEDKKKAILDSRVQGTHLLSKTLAEMETPPKVMVCASAIGFYGNRGDEVLTEESGAGSSFLSEVVQKWEAATDPAREKSIRVVHTRFGVILSPEGGALEKMLLPFKMGLGGFVGDGEQWWSWVAMDDVIGAIHHALTTDSLQGPVNVVAPNPVKNKDFTRTLGHVLSRPTLLPMPAFAARLALGEMADELLLSSARVNSTKLSASNYKFKFTKLEPALRHLLGK